MLETQTIRTELASCIAVLDKWLNNLNPGIPGLDGLPVSDESVTADFIQKLVGEINLVSGRCKVLATCIIEGL